jgi:multidrug efflux pump subunit AcrB
MYLLGFSVNNLDLDGLDTVATGFVVDAVRL